MPRTNTDTLEEMIVGISYSYNSTVAEVIEGIETIQKLGKKISDNSSLEGALETILKIYGEKVEDFKKPEEYLSFLRGLPKDKSIGEMQEEKDGEETEGTEKVEDADEFESKSLNSQETKALLADYEEHLKKLGDEKKALDKVISDNPMFDKQTVADLIKAKSKFTNEELTKAAEIEEIAKGKVETEQAREIAKTIVQSENIRQTAEKIKGQEPELAAALEVVATEVIIERRVAENQVVVGEIIGAQTERIADEIAKVVVDTEESKVVQEREKIVIKQIVDQKIREVVDDPTLKLSETKLVSEVIEKLNVPKAKAEEIIAVLVRESPQIEAQKTDGELGQRIDQINEDQTAEKIYVGMIESGATVREAQRAMDFMREMEPSTKEVAVCRQTLERNGYSPNNEAATEQAISFKHLVTSKTKFSENLETIKSITNRIGGLNKTVLSIGKDGDKKAGSVAKKVANLEQVQKFFEKNPAIVKSVERIQQLLNTRNLVYKAVGWTVEKMGMTGAVEGIKTFGIEMATKYGGQWAGAMATHFAEYGSLSVEGGIQSIVRQLLSKGATTAVKAGATATAEGAAAAAGGAAAATAEGAVVAAEATNPVGWIMLAIEAVLIVGKWLWDKGTKAIQWFFEETGIKPGEALAGLGIAVATGATTIATTMISIPAMMSSAVLSPWLLGGLLVAVPVYNYIQTTEKMTSPLVMNMGNNGDESSVPTTPGSGGYNPGAPGLPGEDLPGSSCSVADKVVLTKQNAPPWGSMALPQGCSFANAACGPTCVSMILRHGNGSYTPNTVVYGPLNGKSSPYGGLGCDGSGFGEAISAYNIMGISASGVRTCSQTDIYNWICQGKVVMILADFYKNNEGGFGGHYVLGVATKDKKIFTADPYYTNIRGSEGGLNPSFDGGGVGHIAPGRTPTCVTIDAASIP